MAFKRVLVTSGPTAVPIDRMRVITNHSTGEMGRLIARAFFAQGYHVTLLEGEAASCRIPLDKKIKVLNFFYYDAFARLLKQELGRGHDVVIHAAAVSDFELDRPFKGKLSSGGKLRLELTPTRKLVNHIKQAARSLFLVGFKLETKLTRPFIMKKVQGLFKDAGCGLVVANTSERGRYKACLIWPDGRMSARVDSKKALVRILVQNVQKSI